MDFPRCRAVQEKLGQGDRYELCLLQYVYPPPPDGMVRSDVDGSWPDGQEHTRPTLALELSLEIAECGPAAQRQRRPGAPGLRTLPPAVGDSELDLLSKTLSGGVLPGDRALFELYDLADGSVLAWLFLLGTPHWAFFEDRREFSKRVASSFRMLHSDHPPNWFKGWSKQQRKAARLKERVA